MEMCKAPLGSHVFMKQKSHRDLACLRTVLSNGFPTLVLSLSPSPLACISLWANGLCYHDNPLGLR